jgi:hypothetical protein
MRDRAILTWKYAGVAVVFYAVASYLGALAAYAFRNSVLQLLFGMSEFLSYHIAMTVSVVTMTSYLVAITLAHTFIKL